VYVNNNQRISVYPNIQKTYINMNELETFRIIGVDVKKLNSKPIHNRIETEKLLGVTNQTLNKFKKKGWIKTSKYKNRSYFTTQSIIECIKYQLQIDRVNSEWRDIWN